MISLVIGDGHALSAALGVSPTTVRTDVQAVLTKLGVYSLLAAATFAVRHRLGDNHSVRGCAGARRGPETSSTDLEARTRDTSSE